MPPCSPARGAPITFELTHECAVSARQHRPPCSQGKAQQSAPISTVRRTVCQQHAYASESAIRPRQCPRRVPPLRQRRGAPGINCAGAGAGAPRAAARRRRAPSAKSGRGSSPAHAIDPHTAAIRTLSARGSSTDPSTDRWFRARAAKPSSQSRLPAKTTPEQDTVKALFYTNNAIITPYNARS